MNVDYNSQNQKINFKFAAPKALYPFRRVEGKIECTIPTEAGKMKNLIYIFHNCVNNYSLIGETGGEFKRRISSYITKLNNKDYEKEIKGNGRQKFFKDFKTNPENFKVGILYLVRKNEDRHKIEKLFIENLSDLYKYNVRAGGGGGIPHLEESPFNIYAVPKNDLSSFSPKKYYPFGINHKGNIRVQFSPGFKKKMKVMRERLEPTQNFSYCIKDLVSGKRLVGVTYHPHIRSQQYGQKAEYAHPAHKKYDPTRKISGLPYKLALKPERFGFGLFPIQSYNKISPAKRKNFRIVTSTKKLEEILIIAKNAHRKTKQGFNSNCGGGGSLSKACSIETTNSHPANKAKRLSSVKKSIVF